MTPCSHGYPGTRSVEEAYLTLTSDPPVSPVLGLKVCAIMSGHRSFLYVENIELARYLSKFQT